MLRALLKKLASFSPIALTKNEYYDRLTEQVIKRICKPDSICVDIGANEGRVLQIFITHCPKAIHYAFEPLPKLYRLLKRKYASAANVYSIALDNKKGTSSFIHTSIEPAYSGFMRRTVTSNLNETELKVQTDCLDDIIPSNTAIALIKIDVEGAEYRILQGAIEILERDKPTLLFEFGKGGANEYGVTTAQMFAFLRSFDYKISLLNRFLTSAPGLTQSEFEEHLQQGREYFFIAYYTATGTNYEK